MNTLFDDLKNAFKKKDNALMQIILINIIVFVGLLIPMIILSFAGKGDFYIILERQFNLSSRPIDLLYRPWTIFTYAFLHSYTDILHIVFNMLFLYWFGKLIAEYLGERRVVSLYVLGAIVGGISFLLLYGLVPQFYQATAATVAQGGYPIPMKGASAAVFAVMVAAATLLPNYTFHLLLIGPVKIKYIAAFWILISLVGLMGDNAGGQMAHLGGAIIGYIFIIQLNKGRDIGSWINAILYKIANLFKKKPKMTVSHKRPSKVTSNTTVNYRRKNAHNSSNDNINKNTEPDQEEIDAILDKIYESGYESLSKEEKQRLAKASKK